MSARTKKPARAPFAHAEDLAPALRDLSDAIRAVIRTRDEGAVPLLERDARFVTLVSESALWRQADEQIEAWRRVGAAARRVHVAKFGQRDAVQWDGFKRSPKTA